VQKKPLNYRDAGVDINAGNQLIEKIKPFSASTLRPEVLTGIGGFGALFELPLNRYRRPVLVSGTDGVGTKLKIAHQLNRHDTIGIDLVAMCVNDIIVQGAEPLFFLDYFATGQLNTDVAADVIKGISEGCKMAGAALTGGETAEMPGMYGPDEYDLAGFCVGIVEKDQIIDGRTTTAGDVILGLASSGPHANGYSLIRKIIEVNQIDLAYPFETSDLASYLLAPTRIYVKSILQLIQTLPVRAIAHITGGGLYENIPRVMPNHTKAIIDASAWPQPAIFPWLQQQGQVEESEMFRTFNCGIGMVIIVKNSLADQAIAVLSEQGETVWQIGYIEKAEQASPFVEMT